MNNQNQEAVIQLKKIGFSLINIRKCLFKLTGHTQPAIAKDLGYSRPTITIHIDGRGNNPVIKKAIAGKLNVPVDVLYDE